MPCLAELNNVGISSVCDWAPTAVSISKQACVTKTSRNFACCKSLFCYNINES